MAHGTVVLLVHKACFRQWPSGDPEECHGCTLRLPPTTSGIELLKNLNEEQKTSHEAKSSSTLLQSATLYTTTCCFVPGPSISLPPLTKLFAFQNNTNDNDKNHKVITGAAKNAAPVRQSCPPTAQLRHSDRGLMRALPDPI